MDTLDVGLKGQHPTAISSSISRKLGYLSHQLNSSGLPRYMNGKTVFCVCHSGSSTSVLSR